VDALNRRFLRSFAGMLIGILLFAQMAVAAYACPSMASIMDVKQSAMAFVDGNSGDSTGTVASNQITNCEDMAIGTMDPQNANLCAEHCKVGQQSDKTSTLTVPAGLLMALYFAPLVPAPMAELRPTAATQSALVAASPPHTILHCCFRL
jgi:hypothetical protein